MTRATPLVCLTVLALVPSPLRAAGTVSQDVPVPGGMAAMARSLGIDPVPDRARFVAELARLTHQAADSRNTTRARAAALLGRAAASPSSSDETVPIPLSVALWGKAIFQRPLTPDAAVASIVGDARAAHLCYGLAALDDDTLQFFADHPASLTHLYEHDAALFAAFGNSVRIRSNRIVPPGGPGAAALWEAAVDEPLDRPESFLRKLLERDQGRLAYLYDTVTELDEPHARFALGLWNPDAAARLKRFKALIAVNRSAVPQWEPAKLPFTRPLHDIASILSRIRVEPDGSPSFLTLRSMWTWTFESSDVPSTAFRATGPAKDDGPIDAAWLAQAIVAADTRERRERIDQVAFAQRVFAGSDAAAVGDVLTAVRVFPRFRMLMLTLERMGIRQPSTYVAAARRAQQLSGLDQRREFLAFGQLQGVLALIARMTDVRVLDGPAADALTISLVRVPFTDGRYGGAIAKWIQQELRPVLTARLSPETIHSRDEALGLVTAAEPSLETLLLIALSGGPGRPLDAPAIEWEGNRYRLDIGTTEHRRISRIREKQGGLSIDAALAKATDEAVADALVSWVYAISIGDLDSPVLLSGTAMRRHDFDGGPGDRGLRIRTPWLAPRQEIAVGVPWHVSGSLLGLNVGLSTLSLRRTGGDNAIEAPTLSSNDRETFAAAVAMMNPFDLRDRDRDAIADAIDRGRRRVSSLAEVSAGFDDVVTTVRMDGWRRRALQWTIAHEPERIGALFSMTELLILGLDSGSAGGAGSATLDDLNAWGAAGLASTGCFCTRLARPNEWRLLIGRPQLGLMAEMVTDLNLHVAVNLRELRLPAAVAKAVLSAAVQDFIDEVRPTDFNDWLTLVRTAQRVPRERIEDYVSVATAEGPLMLQTADASHP